MPTYQYRCTECGEDLEAVQKFNDAPLQICPACGGHLRKVFNAVGVVFKGSGFYRTDSRNGSKGGNGTESQEKKSGAETKSTDKEPAGKGSAGSGNSSSGTQASSNGSPSTGQKAATS